MWRTRPPRPAVALAAVLAAALVLLALPVAGARAALSNGDGWLASRQTLVAGGSPFGDTPEIVSISCPDTSLCVALDSAGGVVSTGDPTVATPIWTGRVEIDGLAEARTGDLTSSLSCPAASLCVAVDAGGNAMVSTDPAASSPTWSAPEPIDPGQSLSGVSCASAGLCVAVGDGGQVLVSTDPAAGAGSWTGPYLEDGDTQLNAVSCAISPPASTGAASLPYCVAVDSAGNAIVSTDPAPTPAQPTPQWATVSADSGVDLTAVSCVGGARCVAVGENGGGAVTDTPTQVESWGTYAGWDTKGALDAVYCVPGNLGVAGDASGALIVANDSPDTVWSSPASVTSTPILTIACAGAAVCLAGGGAARGGGQVESTVNPSAATPSWGSPSAIDAFTAIVGVSCPSASWCLEADAAGAVASTSDPGDPTPLWSSRTLADSSAGFTALTCPSILLCVATDLEGDALISVDPSAGGGWAPTSTGDSNGLTSISCAGTTLCVALDGAGADVVTDDPTANVPSWSKPATIDKGIALDSISCPSSTLCVAVDAEGGVLWSTDPTAGAPVWSGPQTLDKSFGLESVSCPSSTLCVATDSGGRVLTSNDPAGGIWSGPDPVDPRAALPAVSCASSAMCVAVSSSGTLLSTADPWAVSPQWTASQVAPSSDVLASVACQPELCAAGDQSGDVLTAVPGYTLSISIGGSGSGTVTSAGLSCARTCTHVYRPGAFVALRAASARGSRFAGWSGSGCDGNGPCLLQMGADQSLSAMFASAPLASCGLSVVSQRVTLPAVNKKRARVSPSSHISLHATCDRAAALMLTGTLVEPLSGRLKRGAAPARSFGLGPVRASARAGQRVTLIVQLPGAALAALAGRASESATFLLSASDPGGTTHVAARAARLTAARQGAR